MPVCTYQDVIGLYISVDVVHFMHFLDGYDKFPNIKFGLVLTEDIFIN